MLADMTEHYQINDLHTEGGEVKPTSGEDRHVKNWAIVEAIYRNIGQLYVS